MVIILLAVCFGLYALLLRFASTHNILGILLLKVIAIINPINT